MNEKKDDLKDEAVFPENLYAMGKSDYVTGNRPNVDCILCSIINNEEGIVSKELYRDDKIFVTLNIYPFNPGHLMVIPLRHIERWRDLDAGEKKQIMAMVERCQIMLEEEFGTTSFNIGMNEGPVSGASIKHLHVHVVPRFPRELGFIDTIGKTRAMVYTIDQVYEKLKDKLVFRA